MAGFNWSTTVAASVESVASFHATNAAFQKLTPPVPPMSIQRLEPLADGSVSEFTFWLGPFPMRWRALHLDVDPNSGFTDVQTSGPFKLWRHVHRFEPDPRGGTIINDHIEYRHRDGWRGLFTRLLFARPMLSLLFAYRGLVLRRVLNSQPIDDTAFSRGHGW